MVRLEAPARISMPRRVFATTYQSTAPTTRPTPITMRAVHRIDRAREDLDVALQVARQRREQRRAAPDDGDQLVEEQDQAEGGEHLVEVVALVERAQRDHFDQHADHQRAEQAEQHAERVGAGPLRGGHRQVGADHVERAVRQVDEVHDAEHQRQPGGHQEQHDAELQAVQQLLEDEDQVHAQEHKKGAVAPRPSAPGIERRRHQFILQSW